MNIVMLQHTFNPTTVGWVRGLEARGHRVMTVIASPKEPHGGWPEEMKVALVPDSSGLVARVASRLLVGRRRPVRSVPKVRELVRVLREFETDAVLVKVYSLRNVIALLVAVVLRLRRVAWIEQAAPPNLEWRILRRLGVIPRRFFTALDARPGGVATPLSSPIGGLPVITYSPDAPVPRLRPPLGERPVRVLTVAAFWNLEPKRAHWTLEAAQAAGLNARIAQFTFVALGRENSRGLIHLRERIAELGHELDVTVRTNVPYRDMSAVNADHDVLVLPSSREQFGIAVPEAMAHGLAVIAADCVGSVGCIVPGETGELFRTAEQADLVRILGALVRDPARIERMRSNAREFIAQHASSEVTSARIETLLLP